MDETMDENGSIEAEGQQGASEAQDGAQRDLPELVEDLSCGNRRRRQEAMRLVRQDETRAELAANPERMDQVRSLISQLGVAA